MFFFNLQQMKCLQIACSHMQVKTNGWFYKKKTKKHLIQIPCMQTWEYTHKRIQEMFAWTSMLPRLSRRQQEKGK